MPLIDGIGDEVVHFAAAVVVMTVAALAWWSTNARPDRYRASLMMRTQSHHPVLMMRSHARHPVTVSIRTSAPPQAMLYTNRQSIASREITSETVLRSPSNAIANGPSNNTEDVVPLQEMDSIVDADMALLDNNRLHFYRRVITPHANLTPIELATDEPDTQEDAEPASNAQIREMDSIVNAMEADVATTCDVFSRPSEQDPNSEAIIARCRKEIREKKAKESHQNDPQENNSDQNEAGDQTTDNTNNGQANDRKILIRLKYLNDTLKEVEGSLDELLKDFKWRHFSNELMSDFRVRLIFNGRVLGDDATLSALGLHHRAVVHCLVHPRRHAHQRGGSEAPLAGAAPQEAVGARAAPERAWDLENILMTLVSVALTVVWFFRCEYSNMFTASASVALFGLTVFYSVAIFGLYLSDTFHFDRRQPQPVPNN